MSASQELTLEDGKVGVLALSKKIREVVHRSTFTPLPATAAWKAINKRPKHSACIRRVSSLRT